VQTFRIFRGDPVPRYASDFAGIVLLGGSMGVHDRHRLTWINDELDLVRAADELGIPVAGHCLGSQMLAFALGGDVGRLEQPEIGWQPISTMEDEFAKQWWIESAGQSLATFQWHQDTFTPPPGAVQIAKGPFCKNQVFVVRDKHLLVQSHLEITPELVRDTLEKNRAQLMRQLELGNPAVQPIDAMLHKLPQKTAAINRMLARLYERWARGLHA
jgi:GMP synthase-like glutamine amidotransferase